MGLFHFQLEPIMASRRQIPLPRQWPEYVRSGIPHAISLASVVLSYTQGSDKLRLAVRYIEGRKHLPVIDLLRAA